MVSICHTHLGSLTFIPLNGIGRQFIVGDNNYQSHLESFRNRPIRPLCYPRPWCRRIHSAICHVM
jgi:hypothetical protein